MRRLDVLLLGLAVLSAAGAAAETISGLPLHVHRFDSGAVRVWLGDHVSSTATVAIPTAKGVVVIDTVGTPSVDRELRRVIARELGRDDFALLVNTHDHADHTGGNEVYADCEIVGHELVAPAMAQQAADRQRTIEWGEHRIAEIEGQIAGLAPGAPEEASLREQLAVTTLSLAAARAERRVVPPTRTFSDRLELDMGDAKLELFYVGGMHSASDVAVLVAKHRLLLTGDTMADVWLTDTPGCLASFAARSGIRHDFPLLLKNWNLLLARRDDVGTIVTGHWNGELSWAGFEARVKYVETLWQGVQRMAGDGATLEAVRAEHALPTRFPDLVGSRGFAPRFNDMTIREMWGELTGQRYAADVLSAVQNDAAEFTDVVARIAARAPSYYFDEPSLNGLGYWLLEIGKTPQAAEVFRLVVDLFPESWNAHDSLAECLLRAGDRAGAIAGYTRSLELNPDNANGKHMLEQIRNGVEHPTPIPPVPAA